MFYLRLAAVYSYHFVMRGISERVPDTFCIPLHVSSRTPELTLAYIHNPDHLVSQKKACLLFRTGTAAQRMGKLQGYLFRFAEGEEQQINAAPKQKESSRLMQHAKHHRNMVQQGKHAQNKLNGNAIN